MGRDSHSNKLGSGVYLESKNGLAYFAPHYEKGVFGAGIHFQFPFLHLYRQHPFHPRYPFLAIVHILSPSICAIERTNKQRNQPIMSKTPAFPYPTNRPTHSQTTHLPKPSSPSLPTIVTPTSFLSNLPTNIPPIQDPESTFIPKIITARNLSIRTPDHYRRRPRVQLAIMLRLEREIFLL